VISQPDLVLFTTMHGIAKILDRHGAELRCRLALIEDACYKIYQPKVAKARCAGLTSGGVLSPAAPGYLL
jgi:hypothetical protein